MSTLCIKLTNHCNNSNSEQSKNKGFTLLELLIVISIIAVLTAVVAPLYVSYLERSKESKDLQIATTLIKATTLELADPLSAASQMPYITVSWGHHGTDPFTVSSGSTTLSDSKESIGTVLNWYDGGTSWDIPTPDSKKAAEYGLLFTVENGTGNIFIGKSDPSGTINANVAANWGHDGIGLDP